MEVRIKFSADVVITACDVQEARRKWESMPLWSEEMRDAGAEFSEVLLIEDADTCEDLKSDFY